MQLTARMVLFSTRFLDKNFTISDADFLAAIPGLGNRMVREFMEYRP